MDEFIKAIDLRRKEIGLQEALIPKLTTAYLSLGSTSRKFHNIHSGNVAFLTECYIDYDIRLKRILTKTTTYTALNTDCVLLVTSAAAWTLTLPAAATATGQILIIKKTDAAANAVTIDGNGAELIDGAATNAEIDAQYDCLILLCDGTGWHIIGRKIS